MISLVRSLGRWNHFERVSTFSTTYSGNKTAAQNGLRGAADRGSVKMKAALAMGKLTR